MNPEPAAADGDEVLAEVDLLFSRPKENSDLHVLQYPLRHAVVGIGNDRQVTAVNLRPKYGRVEVKISVFPTEPDGDSFGNTCPSFDQMQPNAHEKQIGNEQTLRSRSTLAPPDTNYAVAMYRPTAPNGGPAFIVVPVRTVSQLRPAFDYIDKRDLSILQQRADDRNLRANARGEGNNAQKGADDEEAVDVGFRRRETERAAERRRNSHATLRQQEETEAWLELQYFPCESDTSSERRDALFLGAPTEGATVPRKAGRRTYTGLFLEHARAERLIEASPTGETVPKSMRALERMPTTAAVEQVMTQARIATMADIVRLIGGTRSPKEIISATRVVAMCVRGCWVAKKGGKEIGGERTNARERYEAARVLIIDMFRRSRIVTTMAAQHALGDPLLVKESTIKSVLQEVAIDKRSRGWELRIDDDDDFKRQNETLCRTQDADWERRLAAAHDTLAKSARNKQRRATIQ